MIITITKVEQAFTSNGAEYKKVTGISDKGQETTKAVFDNLKEKWPLLQEGKTLGFQMVKRGQFWNVADISEVEVPPPNKEQELTPKHQEIIDDARREVKAPQELGMWWKEAGELIRLPKEQALEMVTSDLLKAVRAAYYSQMFSVLGIKVEDKKGD